MIKIDLNIKIDDLKPKEDFKEKKPIEVSESYIQSAFTWLQTQPKRPNDPASAGLTLPEQRKIYKILDALDKHKEGIVELDDDLYNYLKDTFNKVEWVGGTRIVVRVADAIDNIIKEKPTEKDAEVQKKE